MPFGTEVCSSDGHSADMILILMELFGEAFPHLGNNQKFSNHGQWRMDQCVFKADRSEDHSIAFQKERFAPKSPTADAHAAYTLQLDGH